MCALCVCAGWTAPSKVSPLKLWDDSGSTGRKGSLWQVGSLGLLHASEGHELAATDGFFDLLQTPLAASHHFVCAPAPTAASAQPVTNEHIAKSFAANAQAPRK